MSDIFISYARSTEAEARRIGEALRALGYGVWRDDEIPAHRAYADVIEERLSEARAVVVIWSADAAGSEWVRSEAERARADHKLVQLTVDGAKLPMPFDQTQCADMSGWSGDIGVPNWQKIVGSVEALVGRSVAESAPAARPTPKLSICVLPFANMSGEAEQEYFSDGISEDIITDLSKVSALAVVSRNSAFRYKGQHVDLPKVARELGVSHVLEGSVRKAGGRVRITAQLIDGETNDHVWAERYDRDLTDIFTLQDEISQAIVGALKLKLLPEEKKAIEQRGTDSAEAYDLYLMARRQTSTANDGDPRLQESIIRLSRRAIEIDPAYARTWAMMAIAQLNLRATGRKEIDPWPAVEKALALDPNLAEAHSAKSNCLRLEGRMDEAVAEAEIALRLDPESISANSTAGGVYYSLGRFADAVPLYEKATALEETAFGYPAMLVACYTALGDGEAARRSARISLERAEAALAKDAVNGSALAYGVGALAVLGEGDRARDWIRRALMMDPDNQLMRYNLACALSVHLHDIDGAIELLGPYFAKSVGLNDLSYARIDPDLDPLRGNPRFAAMLAEAEARLTGGNAADEA